LRQSTGLELLTAYLARFTPLDSLAHISFTGVEPAPLRSPLRTAAHLPVPSVRRSTDEEALDPLMSWMLSRAGLQPTAYRAAAMQRRVSACLRQLRVRSPESARELLERKPELLPLVLNTALIGVSEFFRDRPVFDYLRDWVLPALLETKDGLRVCSAGVSGGQEIYSVAILLAEAGVLENSRLIGVDCRPGAIARAREGSFGADDMAGVEAPRKEHFFQPTGVRWTALPVLKDRIEWRVEDLLNFEAGWTCDLILFRNVAIYFNEAHSHAVWTRLCDQLSDGGFLVTGKAEKPPTSLPLTRVAPSIYRKTLSEI
jgi:chemotaxis protein methyltransferase CheR